MPRLRSLARVAVLLGWAMTLAALAVVQLLGDRTALGTLALFGPRHLTPLPWLPVALLAATRSWRWVAAALLGALVALVGVGGFVLPRPRPAAPSALRVVTYNTDASVDLAARIGPALTRWDADLVLLIDCRPPVMEVIGRQPGYTLVHDGFACVLSRHPVLASQRVPESLADPVREAGVSRARRVLRVDVVVDERPVTLYAVHLESPRDALFAARHFDGSRLQDNAERRSLNSRAASQFVDRSAPGLLVLGDFNLTVESALFRRDWGDLVNAFSVAGRGFGHTMFAGRHRVRIDHVLAGPAWRPIRAVVESGFPSEHQPVVVEFARGEGR